MLLALRCGLARFLRAMVSPRPDGNQLLLRCVGMQSQVRGNCLACINSGDRCVVVSGIACAHVMKAAAMGEGGCVLQAQHGERPMQRVMLQQQASNSVAVCSGAARIGTICSALLHHSPCCHQASFACTL